MVIPPRHTSKYLRLIDIHLLSLESRILYQSTNSPPPLHNCPHIKCICRRDEMQVVRYRNPTFVLAIMISPPPCTYCSDVKQSSLPITASQVSSQVIYILGEEITSQLIISSPFPYRELIYKDIYLCKTSLTSDVR